MIGGATFSSYEFETVRVDRQGRIVQRETGRAECLRLPLGDLALDMTTLAGGAFVMGSSPDEAGRWQAEGPTRTVEVAPFAIGRTPLTQAQWQVIAALPAVARELDPRPSRFEGASLPVENLNWFDAVEGAARIAAASGLPFRLPTEAEWELACRAGSESAFAYGDTLSPELANYFSENTYGDEAPRASAARTTIVGSYPANAFGLFDMHGNVFEWCADAWHYHYREAPLDGGAWLVDGYQNYRPLRGGAWCTDPRGCRSAFRSAAHQSRDHRMNTFGVRLALTSNS